MVVAQPPHVPPQVSRWQIEQVFALAPTAASVPAAEQLAVPARWADTGCDEHSVWGRCTGGSSEPYDCAVDHVRVRFRCTCASRRRPCKHALALLLLWSRGSVVAPDAGRSWRPHWLAGWLAEAGPTTPVEPSAAGPMPSPDPPSAASGGSAAVEHADGSMSAADPADEVAAGPTVDEPPVGPDRSTRDAKVDGARAGLVDFDTWLHDRIRSGLADPAIAAPHTWETAAARLVDAKAGGLANRVRRLSVLGGSDHARLLEELALLHLLVTAARHHADLPPSLADGVATAVGWQVRQADVLAGVPVTDHWTVMGRSDTREDRIEVRRVWLRGAATGAWAMVLSFAAYQQVLDDSLRVGQRLHADVFRYPGPLGLRALVGRVHEIDHTPAAPNAVGAVDLLQGCDEIGAMIAAEPWIERVPACVRATPVRAAGGWTLADASGALPLTADIAALDTLDACCAGGVLPVVVEWTAAGLVPLAVFLDDRAVDIGPLADDRFVAAGLAGGAGGARA